MSAELKPCPFCGGSLVSMYGPTCTKSTPYDAAHRAFPIVRCRCGVEVWGKDWDQTGASAIEKWNKRTPSAPGAPQEAAAVPAVGQEAMLRALKFHRSASHVSPDFRDLFNATLQQHFDNYVRYGAALAGGDGGEG